MRLLRAACLLPIICLCIAAAARAQNKPILLSLSVTPARVTGGASATGTVRLSNAAPAGGAQLDLSALSAGAATVPPAVTVPPGQESASFTVRTQPVTSETAVLILASGLGPAQGFLLTVVPPAAPAPIPLGVGVGDPVSGTESSRLGSPRPGGVSNTPGEKVLGSVPAAGGVSDADRDDRAVRGVGDDGSLTTVDSAGTALVRLGAGDPAIRLDTSALDDGVGIARLLRVEVNRSGISGVVALRADNTRGVYRLDATGLHRLGLLPDRSGQFEGTRDPEELAISEAGQIAFAAPDGAGALTVFQTGTTGAPAALPLTSLFGDRTVTRIRHLQSNRTGDLVFRVEFDQTPAAIVRKTNAGLQVVAKENQTVPIAAGSDVTGELSLLLQPRIGADGTVVFLGASFFPSNFANFYAARPGRALGPLLPGSDWDPDDADAAAADDGSVAVRASNGYPVVTSLFLAPPGGSATPLDLVRPDTGALLQPRGRLTFGSGSRLYFLATDAAASSIGDAPAGLYRYRPGQTGIAPVAVPGDPVPGKPELRLRSVTQAPTLGADRLAIEAEYPAPGLSTAATTGFFLLPLDGALGDGRLVAEEGGLLPGGNRLAMLRQLSYNANGTLVFSGLQPGAGPILAAISPAGIAAKARTAAAGRPAIDPLLAIGKPLDRPDHLLQAFLGPPIALGQDRQLLAARYSDASGAAGEGLFVVDRSGQATPVAITGGEIAAVADTKSRSAAAAAIGCATLFSSADPGLVGLPSVTGDASRVNVVFKARLTGTDAFGAFQWLGGADLLRIGRSDTPLIRGDPVPYGIESWAAGPPGSDPTPPAYLLVRNNAGQSRLFQHSSAGLRSVVDPSVPTDVRDFVVTGDGQIWVYGVGNSSSGIYRVTGGQLAPVAESGGPLPPSDDPDQNVQGLRFGTEFGLMPDSTHAGLLFRADAVDAGGSLHERGLFRIDAQNRLQTLLVEGQTVDRERQLTVTSLADALDQQSANGTVVTAVNLGQKTGWVLYRIRANATGTDVIREALAQERAGLPAVPVLATMDPSLLLDLPCRSGPLFSLNTSGDAALLASDGQRWGIYLFPAK